MVKCTMKRIVIIGIEMNTISSISEMIKFNG
jgi:hypothetical protein